MSRRITIIQGHPDPTGGHLGHALAEAYAQAAAEAGHELREIDVARLDFPLLRTQQAFDSGEVPPDIREAQAAIAWAEHLVFFYPLWMGGMPALLKGFLEQTFRPGFAVAAANAAGMERRLLKGRSARIVVTMGMPASFYRWYFRAHGLKSFKRNILAFCGIGPVRETLIGMTDALDAAMAGKWLARMRVLGRKAE